MKFVGTSFILQLLLTEGLSAVLRRAAVTVRAGERALLPCPGLTDTGSPGGGYSAYIINHLSWRCATSKKACPAADPEGRLVEYVSRTVRVHGSGERLGLDRSSWSLVLSPVTAADNGTYSCFFNSQVDQRLVELVVLDVPKQPGRPTHTHHSSRHVTLSWVPSFPLNNMPIEYYLIQTRLGESGSWPPLEEALRTDGAVTSANVTGLQPFTLYTFRVISVNELGRSEPSQPSYPVKTLREPPRGAPTFTGAHNLSATSVEVTWDPPPSDTINGELTGYLLSYWPLPAGVVKELVLRNYERTSRVIEDLKPFTKYQVMLQLTNLAGTSPSANITVTTAEGVPSAPENMTFSEVSDRSVTVIWERPRRLHGRLLGYTVYWETKDDTTSSRNITDPLQTSCTIDGLEPDRQYTVWLKAFTGAGPGQRSQPVQRWTDVSGPGAPRITDVTCPGDTTLHLRWRRPGTFYRSVDEYNVLYRDDEALEFEKHSVLVTSAQQYIATTISNMTRGHVYEIVVEGVTRSRMTRDRIYRGELSTPRKVRMEEGCREIQPVSTWSQVETTAIAGAQLAGILVSCLLVTFLLVGAIFWWRRRHLSQIWKPVGSGRLSPDGSSAGWSAAPHHAVPAHVFPQAVHELHADGAAGFRREWTQLRPRGDDTETAPLAGKPGGKLAMAASHYQQTRVSVSSRQYRSKPQPAAYLVDGYRRAGAFLVSERPRATTRDALWRLVWEQRVRTVVLMGPLQGEADQPWPEPGSTQTFTTLRVQTRSQHAFASFTVRRLGLSKTKASTKKKRPKEVLVKLFQYNCWPEYGHNENPLSLLEFVHQIQSAADEPGAPVMVLAGSSPSSAAVYVVVATLLAQLRHRQELSVLSYWRHALDQCPLFAAPLDEYKFVHTCLLERVMSGETLVPRHQLRQFLEQLQGGCRNSYPYPAAEKQYKHAIALEAHQFAVVSAARPCNQAKNRSLSSIPMEPSRVCLTPRLSQEGSDYINASWLPGFRHQEEFILTQHPLPKTVLDFWQMVWESRVTTVACLTSEDCGSFWPREEEEIIECDGFLVRFLSQAAGCSTSYKTSWVVRTLLVESTEGDVDLLVRLVHLPLWPEESSTDSVMEGVQAVTEIHGDRLSPLVVIDRNGGTEGVMFCVLSSVLRQLQYQPQFDIFTYAKLYHQRRPGCWKTMREFLWLYQVVEAWLPAEMESEHTAALAERHSWAVSLTRTPIEAKLNGTHGVMV
ncbi:tyrosine-protein phosphatase 99A-like [Amphibalanus amphitrite]|uniref:tyrosine-protein phosphatase 99A-like n=1 Tax=Amphibalanus amphitrite TaxID=1232801 RepID=UPI001C925686|nr:tyrosine-protein phosphatase 99A-like [Amphibalanus amphitrite]